MNWVVLSKCSIILKRKLVKKTTLYYNAPTPTYYLKIKMLNYIDDYINFAFR